MMFLAIRPKASLNAATAAAGSERSSFWLSSNRREAITLPFLSTSPRRQTDFRGRFGIDGDAELPDIDQKLEIGLTDIGLRATARARYRSSRNCRSASPAAASECVGPEGIGKSRIVLDRREQHPLGHQHRHRRRLRNRQLDLDGLALRRPDPGRAQIVGDLCGGLSPPVMLLEAGHDAVELSGVARKAFREHLEIGDRVLQRPGILAEHGIDLA